MKAMKGSALMRAISSMYGPLSVHAPVRSIVPAHSVATPVGVHTPPVHTSPLEQALPSSQAFVLGGCMHVPVASQRSSVHTLPSLPHGWPAGTGKPMHAPPEQVSLVHTLPSS